MSRRTATVLPSALATLLLCALAPMSGDPAHASTCNAAPKPAAPAGSHWYYRTDRDSSRKCWYLASPGQKVQSAARARPANAGAEPPAPPMTEPAEQLTRPAQLRLDAPASAAQPPASAAEPAPTTAPENAPILQSPAAPDAAERKQEPGAEREFIKTEARVPVSIEPPVAPVVSTGNVTASASGIGALQFVLIALAAVCLLTSAALSVARARRRRPDPDQLDIVDLNTKAPLRAPTDADTAAPSLLPAEAAARRHDADIEERLRQFTEAWRRQAA